MSIDYNKCVAIEAFVVRGHRNIRAKHPTTLEFTKDEHLTVRGDCIVGISASKALRDFSEEFKDLARRNTTLVVTLIIGMNGVYDVVFSWGNEKLTYDDSSKIVIRRSNYIAGNTAAIYSDKAAKDIKRELINYLRNDESKAAVVMVTIDLKCFGGFPLTPYFP